ncbi:hypothetical protein [Burkholderia phage BCSR5]|nr:hypothetical protein [Burkholderia phage BCSR5]
MCDDYYCYVLLDPRKPGKFKYGSLVFNHEPFYVGKGKRRRCTSHIRSAKKGKCLDGNRHKFNKIRSILRAGSEVIVQKSANTSTEERALAAEQRMIRAIGRSDLGEGPLTNLSDGGEDQANLSEKVRRKIARTSKRNWNALTDEEKAQFSASVGKAAKAAWEACSETEKAKRIAKAKAGIHAMSPEAKVAAGKRKSKGLKQYWSELSESERSKVLAARRAGKTEESRRQQSEQHKGWNARRSPEEQALTSKRMTKAWKNRKPKTCPHCDTSSVNYANLTRWHFDNCKHRRKK